MAQATEPVSTIKEVEDRDVPEGSQIPEWRIEATETKVQELKTQMRALQQQEQAPQEALPKPEGEQQ